MKTFLSLLTIAICLSCGLAQAQTDHSGTYSYKPKDPNMQGEIQVHRHGHKIAVEIIVTNNKTVVTQEIDVAGTMHGAQATLSNAAKCHVSMTFHAHWLNLDQAGPECLGANAGHIDVLGKYVYAAKGHNKLDAGSAPGATTPKMSVDTSIAQCKLKGFYPRMTLQEASKLVYDQHLQDKLADETMEDIALRYCRLDKNAMHQELVAAVTAIQQENAQALAQQDHKKLHANKNRLRQYLHLLGQGYENACLSKRATFHVTASLSGVLFNNQGYTQGKFAKEFGDNYNVPMYIYKHIHDKGVYRYKNEENGCEIKIFRDLSLDLHKSAGIH